MTAGAPVGRVGRAGPAAFVALIGLAALTGCQTTPGPGSEIRAQVTAVPLTRAALDRGATQGDLHAALRAGATAADAAASRLVLATCAMPEPETAAGPATPGIGDRLRHHTLSTVLPPGVVPVRDALLQLQADADLPAGPALDGRHAAIHARFLALAPAGTVLDERSGLPWQLPIDPAPRLLARCRLPEAAPGVLQASVFRSVSETELAFARAEAARHAQFSDAEIAAGRAVRVRCQLKMADGAAWHTPEFLARAPAGLALRPGDVVRLRAGVDEGSKQGAPVGEVLAREGSAPAPGGRVAVGCR